MAEFEIEVVTPDGKMGSFVAHPDGNGPFPAVILYMDAPGIREELRDFARRIASQGYFCLLPDMYYRNGQLRLTNIKPQIYEVFEITKLNKLFKILPTRAEALASYN